MNEELVEKVKQILTQYLNEEIGNRVSQFSVKGLSDVLLDIILQHKNNDCKPIVKKTVDESTGQKITRK